MATHGRLMTFTTKEVLKTASMILYNPMLCFTKRAFREVFAFTICTLTVLYYHGPPSCVYSNIKGSLKT